MIGFRLDNMKLVYPILTRTGLCNKLFPWARAVVYAKNTGARMIAPKWTDLMRIGPWLRFEKDKRYYLNEFTNKGYLGRMLGWRTTKSYIRRHQVKTLWGMDTWFDEFLDSQALIKSELRRIANPKLVAAADRIGRERYIGVHIRRGDFVTNGQWIPDEWYVAAIANARELVGNLPVKIFSDGDAAKLKGILSSVQNVTMMPAAAAVQDLLALSQAEAIVGTANSSFSMWAVFLGQVPSVWKVGSPLPRLYLISQRACFI